MLKDRVYIAHCIEDDLESTFSGCIVFGFTSIT